jgi:predicted transcriptional regulator
MNAEYDSSADVLAGAAQIVRSYVANNSVSATDLPALIADVHRALTSLGEPTVEPEPELVPAVPVKKSVTPDFIICLDDGKKFKSLKRHLGQLGMTPAEYRTKWGLPSDYPMVARTMRPPARPWRSRSALGASQRRS